MIPRCQQLRRISAHLQTRVRTLLENSLCFDELSVRSYILQTHVVPNYPIQLPGIVGKNLVTETISQLAS